MKKFNFRTVLVLLLVVIMAVALVACHKKDDDNNNEPPPITANSKEYFAKLFTMIDNKTADAIGSDEDLKVAFDVQLNMGAATTGGYRPVSCAGLGFDVEAVIDRSTPNKSEHTAAKVRIYTTSGLTASPTDICTLYVFLDDPLYDTASGESRCIYVDISGQQIRIPVDSFTIDGKHFYDLPTVLFNALGKNIVADNKNPDPTGLTVNNILDAIVGNMGPDWSLDAFVTSIFDLVGKADTTFDLKQKLENAEFDIAGAKVSLGNMIADILLGTETEEKTVDDMFDANGNLKVSEIVKGDVFADLFTSNVKTNKTTGVNTYELELDKSIFSILGIAVNMPSLFSNTKDKDAPYIKLSFEEKNNALESVSLYAQLLTEASKFGNQSPYINVKVNRLDISKRTTTNDLSLPNKDDYSYDVAIDSAITLKLNGFGIDPNKFSDRFQNQAPTIDLSNTEIKLGIKANFQTNHILDTLKLDVFANINKSELLAISYAPYEDGSKGHLTVKANPDAKIGTNKVLPTVFSLFGEDIYKGVNSLFTALGHPELMTQLESAIFDSTQGTPDHTKFNENFKGAVIDINMDSVRRDVKQVIQDVKGYLKKWNDNNHLNLEKEMDIVKKFTKTYADEWFDYIKAVVMASLMKQTIPDPPAVPPVAEAEGSSAVEAADGPGAKEYIASVVDMIRIIFPMATTGDGELSLAVKDVLTVVSSVANTLPKVSDWSKEASIVKMVDWLEGKFNALDDKRIPEKLATGITIKGEDAFSKTEPTARDYIDYLVRALFNSLNVNLTLDCTDGFEIDVKATVSTQANAELSLSLALKDSVNCNDYYQEYNSASDKTGWNVFQ